MVAWAQDPPAVPDTPSDSLLIHLLEQGGLPAVLAFIGWYLRGLLLSGIPVVAQLGEVDRQLLRDLVDQMRKGAP